MPIIVVGNEKDFAALRPRLFSGNVSAKAAAEAAKTVRKANPGVDLDNLAPGTVLVVPEALNLEVRGDLSLDETTKNAVEGAMEFGKKALEGIAEGAAKRESETKAERRRVLKALDSIGQETARPRERGLAKELEAARNAVAEEDKRAKERASALKKAQAEWTAGLDALNDLAG